MKKFGYICMILLSTNLWASKTTNHGLTQADPHSFANFNQVKVTNMSLDLEANFKKNQLQGTNTIQYKVLDADSKYLILDTRDLDIKRITYIDGK